MIDAGLRLASGMSSRQNKGRSLHVLILFCHKEGPLDKNLSGAHL